MLMSSISKFKQSPVTTAVREAYLMLDSRSRKRLVQVTILQSLLSVLDIVAIFLVGIVGSIAVLGVQSKNSPSSRILTLMKIDTFGVQSQVLILSVVIAILLIFKTLLSGFVVWRTTRYFARIASKVSANIAKLFFQTPINEINKSSSQNILYSITTGVNVIVVGVVATASTLISDSFLLMIMMAGLFIASPIMAATTLILFTVVGVILHRTVGLRSRKLAEQLVPLQIKTNESIIGTVDGFREFFVSNILSHRLEQIENNLEESAMKGAKQSFLPYLSKYFVEGVLVFSILFLTAVQFFMSDAVESVSTLAIFLAASMRISPAALRIQQGISTIMNGHSAGQPTMELLRKLQRQNEINGKEELYLEKDEPYGDINNEAIVRMREIHFQYEKQGVTINMENLEMFSGDRIAIVGRNGSGKSTFVDILLGLLRPQRGTIEIKGKLPRKAIEGEKVRISYIPQKPHLLQGTIKEIVTFGRVGISRSEIWKVLEIVGLKEYIKSLPSGLYEKVNEGGKNFSGGQRQRLNLARALLSKPEILILDEATSALDLESEERIMNELIGSEEIELLVSITHKIKDLEDFNKIIFVDRGKVYFSEPVALLESNKKFRQFVQF